MPKFSSIPRILMGAIGLALLLTACGDKVDPGDQVSIGGARFEKIRFDDIPRPDNAESKGQSTEDGVETEEFEVAATGPEQVLTYYAERLPALGWEPVLEPNAFNPAGDWLGQWTLWNRDIVVRAETGEADGDGGPTPAVYTLSLSHP